MKKKLGEIIIQIIPVMIGVYLGFVVSNWSDQRKVEHQSDVLINSIKLEMETNASRIKNSVDYHIMLRDSARVYFDSPDVSDFPDVFRGTRIQTLSSSAFQTGNQTGIINELSVSRIQALNQLYTHQLAYDDLGKMILESLINMDFAENEESIKRMVRFLAITMTDVVIQEQDLLNGYEFLLKDLEH